MNTAASAAPAVLDAALQAAAVAGSASAGQWVEVEVVTCCKEDIHSVCFAFVLPCLEAVSEVAAAGAEIVHFGEDCALLAPQNWCWWKVAGSQLDSWDD